MKKGLILIFLLLVAIPLVSASPVITLTSPTVNQDFTDTNSVTFQCSVTDIAGDITALELFTDIGNPGGGIVINHTETHTGTGTLSINYEIPNIPIETYSWTCRVISGSGQQSASPQSFTVSYVPPQLEFSGTIDPVTWDEDTINSSAFDLDDYFIITGGTGTETPTFSFSGNSSIIISVAGDNQVSFSAPANWNGTETISIDETVGSSTATSNYIVLTVTGVNDAPHFTNIPNQTWTQDTNKTITLSDYFTDPEGDSMTYTATDPSHMDVTISGATATLSPEANWTGEVTVRFTANDGSLTNQSNIITLTLTAPTSTNNEPSIDTHSPSSDPTLEVGDSKTFIITKSDEDNDTLTVYWYLNNVEVEKNKDTYTYSEATKGTHLVRVVVSDGTDNATHSWTVKVNEKEELDVNVTLEEADVDSILGEQTEQSECGNGKAEEGEHCGNCPQDVKCAAGEICESNTCVEKASSALPIVAIIVVILILAGVGGGVYYFSTKNKQVQSTDTNVRNVVLPQSQTGEQPAADISDFYGKMKTNQTREPVTQPAATQQPVQPAQPVEPVTPAIAIPDSLKKYVKQMKKLNFSEKQIIEKLEKKGWSATEIKEVLKESTTQS